MSGKQSPDNKREKKAEQKSLSQFFRAKNITPATEDGAEGSSPKQAHLNGNQIKIWHWNVNGVRATINSKKFDYFLSKGKYLKSFLINILF